MRHFLTYTHEWNEVRWLKVKCVFSVPLAAPIRIAKVVMIHSIG